MTEKKEIQYKYKIVISTFNKYKNNYKSWEFLHYI